jgi:diaminopimelate decarboxylase
MAEKTLPFTKTQIDKIIETYPTPFHIYDEAGIRRSARALKQALAWNAGFTNYFAVKALPNPAILRIIKEEGFGADCSSLPELLSFRYNPGPLRSGNAIIGQPEEAKYGLTRKQLFQAYALAKAKGVQRFGLHTMLASNELNPQYFIETARMLFDLVVAISQEVGIRFSFVNLGGGIGIPYHRC